LTIVYCAIDWKKLLRDWLVMMLMVVLTLVWEDISELNEDLHAFLVINLTHLGIVLGQFCFIFLLRLILIYISSDLGNEIIQPEIWLENLATFDQELFQKSRLIASNLKSFMKIQSLRL
jgi:hypothetical protein